MILENGLTYVRRDNRLVEVKRTGFFGFLKFKGTDGTYYTSDGKSNDYSKDIIKEYNSKESKSEGWDVITYMAIGIIVVAYLCHFLTR